MDIETDGTIAGTGAEANAETPAVETSSEATPEQQEADAANPAPADDAGDEAQPKRVPWFQKRIDEVTRQKYEAAREAAYWKGIAEGSRQPQPTQAEASGPPTLEEYNWDEAAYQRANADYYTKQAEKAAERVIEARTQQERQQAQQETAVSRLQQGAAKHADFQEVVSDIPTTEAVVDLLTSNENADEILYELGRNPEAMAHFNRLSPYGQAVELGKIAARLEAPKQATPRNIPPPPPQTVHGLSAGLSKQPEDMSMAEYVNWVRERDKT